MTPWGDLGALAPERPDGDHDHDDGDELQQHAQAHQFLRGLRRATLGEIEQTEQQDNRDRANRKRDQEIDQELGHRHLLPSNGEAVARFSTRWQEYPTATKHGSGREIAFPDDILQSSIMTSRIL